MKALHILAAIAAWTIAATSCDGSENVPYSPAPQPQGQRIYFAASSVSEEVPDDATSATVSLFRPAAVAAEAFTVQLTATGTDQLFHVPSEVTFAAGDTVTPVTITFSADNLTPGRHYPVTITVDEAQANEYGISTVTIDFVHLSWSDWTLMGSGEYTFSLWYEGTAPCRVMERHLTDDPDTAQYQFLAALDEEDPDTFTLYLEASTDDAGATISVPQQTVGLHPAYGDVYLEGVWSFTGDPSYAADSNYDPATGLFTLYMILYCDAGQFGDGREYCQLTK